MSEQHSFGKHWLRIEPDGVIFLKYFGALTLAEMKQVIALSTEAVQRGGDIYMLFDVSEAGSIDAGARKLGIQWLIDIKVAGAANFGGSVISRTAAEMLAAAARLLHKIEVPMAFFKTEAESRAWIAELHQRRAHKS